MNNLIINEPTINSRDVAEMVGKEHKHLLRDIKTYSEYLRETKIGLSSFFKESSYLSEQNKELPCFEVTKKGCEFIAHKLTGQKGAIFTATYINRFHEMEDKLKGDADFTNLSPMLQTLIGLELKQKEHDEKLNAIDSKIDSIKDVVALSPNDWRKNTTALINKMALRCGGYEHIRNIREESYRLLDERFGVSLNTRLTNKKKTLALNGVCKSKIDKVNQLDVIADDKKLIEGYIAVIKDMSVKYEVC